MLPHFLTLGRVLEEGNLMETTELGSTSPGGVARGETVVIKGTEVLVGNGEEMTLEMIIVVVLEETREKAVRMCLGSQVYKNHAQIPPCSMLHAPEPRIDQMQIPYPNPKEDALTPR